MRGSAVRAKSGSLLVLGAGELGMAMLRGLAGRAPSGVELHVLMRPGAETTADPSKQQRLREIRSLGAGLVSGDLADGSVEELAALLGRFETVVGCTGFAAGSGTQMKLARAALEGHVQRYLPWQFGLDYDAIGKGSAQDLFDEQLEVRALLRGQTGTEWIIVSTGVFTSFLFEPSFGVVDFRTGIARALGAWDGAVTATTPGDIGRLTAEVLYAEPIVANQVVYTAGDTLSYEELADTVDDFLGRPLRRELWSLSRLKEELRLAPGDSLRKYRVVFAEGKGVAWPLATTFNGRHGLPATGVKEWMHENLPRPLAS